MAMMSERQFWRIVDCSLQVLPKRPRGNLDRSPQIQELDRILSEFDWRQHMEFCERFYTEYPKFEFRTNRAVPTASFRYPARVARQGQRALWVR